MNDILYAKFRFLRNFLIKYIKIEKIELVIVYLVESQFVVL